MFRLGIASRAGLAALVVYSTFSVASVSAAAARPVTFNRDVAPIVFRHCTSCHRPGEIAPFNLQTYEDVKQRGRLIADATGHRFMPPWKPDPGVGEFEGSRRLSDEQIDVIQDWVEGGMPEGDARDLPALPSFTPGWQLGKPDLVVSMPQAFAMPADGPDVFRNFVLPVSIKGRRYVRAVEFRPGTTRAIHHARILIDESRESRWRDGQDADPGFAGMDAPGAHFPDGHFLGWAAGKSPDNSPFAWPLDSGSDLVVQMHLRPTGRDEDVQASIGLYFTDKAPAALPLMVRLGSRTIDIPPGAAEYVVTDSYTLPVDVQALRIYPHAHYLGKEMTVAARLPTGKTEGLLHISDWDFNWQDDYEYERPVALPRGTTLVMRYVYDNSAANPHNPHDPPERVRFGPEATDEMCELLVQLVPKKAADAPALRADIARKTLATDIAGEEKRIADDPRDYESRNSLGVHYVQVGRVNDALEQFNTALSLAPDHAVAHYNLGVIAMGSQRLDEAAAHFQLALAARPDYVEAHTNFGVLLQRTGRGSEAVAHYRSALAVKPDNAIAHNNLGRSLLALGRADEAVTEFLELTKLQPENAAAHDGLAQAFAATGRHEPALRSAQQALSRALAAKNDAFAREIRQRLQQYQQQVDADADDLPPLR
jgi:Flp pilus assembly protein TadD